MNDSVLRFGGVMREDHADTERVSLSSELFQSFGMWLGAVYAMKHDVAVDPESLAEFDPVSVMPLFHLDAERWEAAALEGLTIEQSWLMQQLLLRRPTTCVVVDRFAGQPLDRITRLRVSSAEALVDDLMQRLARNFRFEGRVAWVAAFEDAYFEPADPVAAGVLVGPGGHMITFQSANPMEKELFYWDPWPTGTLVPEGQPTGQKRLWRISAEALTEVIAYAMIADTPPVERSPDIYADSVRREADPARGAPLDVAWHAMWEIAGPTYCLVSEGGGAGSIERIPYRVEMPVSVIVSIIADAFRVRAKVLCVGHVRLDADRAHSITLLHVDEEHATFHDPWPKGSLLAAGQNALGLNARKVDKGWRIRTAELEHCLQAVFISPEPLAELQNREHRRSFADVLSALAFFNIHETSRLNRDGIHDVEAEPGGFQDKVRVRFALADDNWMEAALLCVERPWLDGPNRPFGVDIIKSFLAATVSPLDADEASFTVRGVQAIMHGREGLMEAVGSGPTHLLGQTRALVTAVLGVREDALVTYAFTRVVARNDDGWLQIGVERAERSRDRSWQARACPNRGPHPDGQARACG